MRLVLAALLLLLLRMPLSEFADYYTFSLAGGQNNIPLLNILSKVRADPGRPIL
jgi:hypothetical protein